LLINNSAEQTVLILQLIYDKMTLAFSKANNVLTAKDSGTGDIFLFTGATVVQMTGKQYYIFSSGCNFSFRLSDISTIGGIAPDPNPETTLGMLKAILPLYA
jgi:hypothetical protein